MAEPISKLIVDDIVDTLTAYISDGNEDFTVERERQGGNSPANRKIVVQVGPCKPQTSAPLGLDEYVMPVKCTTWVIKPEASDPELLPFLYEYAADIRKALCADRNRGGRAVNTTFEDDEFYVEGSPKSAGVTALIRFRTLRNDPYNR
jgi:hypothetical protein